jgi:glucose-6-phosphate 1-dehydrogenase
MNAPGVSVRGVAGGPGVVCGPVAPGVLCILGASGDLARSKLLPALRGLAQASALPRATALVACARELGEETLRGQLGGSGALAERTYVCRGDFDDPAFYRALAERLAEVERTLPEDAVRTFYLATPPSSFRPIAGRLVAQGLLSRSSETPRGRLIVEKPFGHDLQSAAELNRFLLERLDEEQVFRIDHYLA